MDFNINIGNATDSDKLNNKSQLDTSVSATRMTSTSYSAPQSSGGNQDFGIFATANHPIACLFHVLFKGAAIFW